MLTSNIIKPIFENGSTVKVKIPLAKSHECGIVIDNKGYLYCVDHEIGNKIWYPDYSLLKT